jgi:ABC-type nitrate/sulfonate/bicarbonate transport system substrate-binding protein
VSPAELAEDLGYLAPVKLNWVGNTISGPQDIQAAATGQTDFGGAFDGAITKLEVAGSPIQAVISYYGSDDKAFNGYFVLDDSPIHGPRDLIGKKIGVNTLGAHYEAVVTTYLRRNGLNEDEIKQVELTVLPPVNTEAALRQHQIDVAGLGGMLQDKALAAGGVHKLFGDVDLYGPFDAGSYVLRKDFIRDNPNTAKKFVEAVARAIEWEKATPTDQVRARFTKIIQARGRQEDTSQIPFWKSPTIAARGGVISDENFSRWFDWLERNGDITKDQVKASDLYTNALNPYRDPDYHPPTTTEAPR